MSDEQLYSRLVLASSVGVAAAVWGVGTAVFAPRRGWVQAVLALVPAAVVVAAVANLTPHQLWQVTGGLAVVLPLTLSRVRERAAVWLSRPCRPRACGAAVAVLALTGLLYEGWRFDCGMDELADQGLPPADFPPDTAPATVAAYTDLGGPVKLFEATSPRTRQDAIDSERISSALHDRDGQWIRRGPADDRSNCHGWVFAGGRYNLGGKEVEVVLADNGYSIVPDPRAGDVVVYRHAEQVTHTGLVQAVLPDGTVLVESKWGRLGVYLHAAGDSCYGTGYEFRRSPRPGHLLAGLTNSTGKGAISTAP